MRMRTIHVFLNQRITNGKPGDSSPDEKGGIRNTDITKVNRM